jgi:SAM-dependent methyltransferase
MATDSIFAFDQRKNIDGRTCDIGQCRDCSLLINCTDVQRNILEPQINDRIQALSSDQFYSVDASFLAELIRYIDDSNIVDFLFEQEPNAARGAMMDFGAGRGIVAAKAARFYTEVYAVELTLEVLQQVHAHMPDRDRIHISNDLDQVPDGLDGIISMHVMEHVPELNAMFARLAAKLNPGGVMLFQVPMLRNDYIVRTHYVFFNERAVHALSRLFPLEVVGVWYDTNCDFLTAIVRRPLSPAPAPVAETYRQTSMARGRLEQERGNRTLISGSAARFRGQFGPFAEPRWDDMTVRFATPVDLSTVEIQAVVRIEAAQPVALRIALVSSSGAVAEKWLELSPGWSHIRHHVREFRQLSGTPQLSETVTILFGGETVGVAFEAELALC